MDERGVAKGVTVDALGFKEIAQALAYVIVGLIWWIFRSSMRRIEGRVDALEREVVRKEEFNREVESMRADQLSMHEENRTDRRAAQEETRALLARIEGKIDVAAQATLTEQVRALSIELGKIDVYANEIKHNYVDLLVKDVEALKFKVDTLINKLS